MNERSIDNSLEWYIGDKRASVTASEQRLKNKIMKLAKEYPDDVRIICQNEDGSIFASMPRSWIKVGKPRKGGFGNPNGGEALRKWREEKKKMSGVIEDIDVTEDTADTIEDIVEDITEDDE